VRKSSNQADEHPWLEYQHGADYRVRNPASCFMPQAHLRKRLWAVNLARMIKSRLFASEMCGDVSGAQEFELRAP
jgi:hypothetical protein